MNDDRDFWTHTSDGEELPGIGFRLLAWVCGVLVGGLAMAAYFALVWFFA